MATTYSSLKKANEYHATRGNPKEWETASDALKLEAMLASSEYLDSKYLFVGRPETTTQVRQWPRSSAYDRYSRRIEGVPPQIEDSVAILALEYVNGKRFFGTIDAGTTTGEVEMERVRVGSIEVSTGFTSGTGGGSTFDRFPAVDALLGAAGLIETGSQRVRG